MLSVCRVVSVVDRTWGSICSTSNSALGSTLLFIKEGYIRSPILVGYHHQHQLSPPLCSGVTPLLPVVISTWTWCSTPYIISQWSMVIQWCLSRSVLSYGLIVILVGMIIYFIYGAVLRCATSRTNMRTPRCRVLQYVHGLLIFCVAWVTETQTRISGSWRMGIKRTWCFNAMVGFYLNDL
mgnify:CR=1 FL=1